MIMIDTNNDMINTSKKSILTKAIQTLIYSNVLLLKF